MRNSCPLSFWKENSREHPEIFKVAMETCSCPSGSVDSERLFSTAGTRLRPENAEDQIFLSKNLPFFEYDYQIKKDNACLFSMFFVQQTCLFPNALQCVFVCFQFSVQIKTVISVEVARASYLFFLYKKLKYKARRHKMVDQFGHIQYQSEHQMKVFWVIAIFKF